ncbi:hypothetical protein [Thiobacillus sp.]
MRAVIRLAFQLVQRGIDAIMNRMKIIGAPVMLIGLSAQFKAASNGIAPF